MGKRHGSHARTPPGYRRRRITAWLAAMAASGVAVVAATVWLMSSPVERAIVRVRTSAPASRSVDGSTAADGSAAVVSRMTERQAAAPRSPAFTGTDFVLSPRIRRSCPPAAFACADLRDHITWLQSDGRITYGPVRMEPGGPGQRTPRGTFHVAWKAGAHYVSNLYGVPIPYAVFFASGGIAFHAGSLTRSSHGCIHLTLHNARYYHDHLAIGAEVAVF
jgi:hypothetical protein